MQEPEYSFWCCAALWWTEEQVPTLDKFKTFLDSKERPETIYALELIKTVCEKPIDVEDANGQAWKDIKSEFLHQSRELLCQCIEKKLRCDVEEAMGLMSLLQELDATMVGLKDLECKELSQEWQDLLQELTAQ